MSKIRHLVDLFAPNHYKLHLNIDRSRRLFDGTVTITGQPKSNEVRLHAKHLTITKVTTDISDSPQWHQEDDELVITGTAHTVTVQFAGHISETAMNGLYLCKYKLNGHSQELFATQFESHYARECFPCIDEPAAKATFDVSITSADDDSVVLSNMPGQKVGDTWKFATTPRMSTYLLAFAGGELIHKSGATKRGTKVNVYATPAQSADLLDFPLDMAIRSIEFYEDYFNLPYPLPKLDNIALPDFSAGAMENWGLITYRETALLANDQTAEDDREQIATVIAHEIAHQWFGNLVTMKWWNDLWLNESFASLMENTATDHIHPEYRVWDDFETGDVSTALGRDGLPGVQAVQQEVKTPDEIATLFDGAIVYAKGERLLKMLRQLIGETAFRHGLSNYFRQHQYSNTTADDLWASLSAAANCDIKALMEPWLTRPSYPIIYASRDGHQLTLRQTEFVIGGQPTPDKYWPIPLFANQPELPSVMNQPQLTVELPSQTAQPLQLNVGNGAHYVVKYDDQLLQPLLDNFADLAIVDQIKLLRESLLLSTANLQDISRTLSLLSHLSQVDNQAVLATAAGLIGNLTILIQPDSPAETQFKRFTRQLFSRQFDRLFGDAASDNSLNDTKARPTVLGRSVYGSNPAAITYCQQQYQAQANPAAIDHNLRAIILSCIIKHGSHADFNRLWQLYQASQAADFKLDLAAALTATTSKMDASVLLNAITDELIRPQDVIYFVAWLMSNRHTRSLTWHWLRQQWPWIKQVFGGDMGYNDFLQIAGKRLSTPTELAEYDKFCAGISEPALERTIAVGHHAIASTISWIQRNRSVLEQWLVATSTSN